MWELAMRGGDVRTESLFSYLSCEARVPQDHPLRPIRTIVDQALAGLSPAFDRLYSDIGRPSIAPEKLLRALLLQAFYSVRSERQLMALCCACRSLKPGFPRYRFHSGHCALLEPP